MKRSYLKPSKIRLKRKLLAVYSRSSRGKLLIEIDKLFRQVILQERENKCEWCGRTFRLQVAHILPKGMYPRLRYHKGNVLLLCFPCHPEKWHKQPLAAARFIERIKGKNFEDDLKIIDKISPRLTMQRLSLIHLSLKMETNANS